MLQQPNATKPKTNKSRKSPCLGDDGLLVKERQALASPVAAPAASNRRWDELNDQERRRCSAEIGRLEALAQGVPLVASAVQHQRISAIMAAAVSLDAGDHDEQR